MTDLSMPPLNLLPAEAAGCAWPTPDTTVYPGPSLADSTPACTLEGLNGRSIEGLLTLFDPEAGMLHLRMTTPRKPLPLRLDQFRRLRWNEPLQPLPGTTHIDLDLQRLRVPFRVEFKNAAAWTGQSIGHCEAPFGLFVFEPLDELGSVQRWFVPRAAYDRIEIGMRLGDALLEQHSLTPHQLQEALAEQEQLRTRKLGDMLVVRQIITREELTDAIEQQAKMPMVRIGEALIALGYISAAQLDEALNLQCGDRSVPLGELLVKKGLVSRADLQTALARKMGYPLVDVANFVPETDAVTRLPYTVAARTPALPLMMRAGRMVVALEDPSNRRAIDEVEFAAQCKLVPVLARNGVLAAAVDRAYEKIGAATGGNRYRDDALAFDYEPGDASKLLATMEKVEAQDEGGDDATIEQSDNSLVRLINSMIQEAHSQGVSDIHIECRPGREKVNIRFRKDGQLSPYMELPHTYRSALIARLKIMCDLDISERRKPQDGKINFGKFMQGSRLELRVATIPTHSNLEDAVMRLLASSKPIPIDKLNLSPTNLARLKQAANRPYGMLLCVGPTGSGKTTTLHSVLSLINTPERKIWTAEDPIEITQAGLRQVQVNAKIEWTFARALRSFLRADPDVIMVGEVRDRETAQVAIEASLTGHLVLSTLHTNSAPETVTRLLDMGLDPFNFADALLVVLAQRLVRRLCNKCRVARDASAEEIDELLLDHMHVMSEVEGAPTRDDVLADWCARFGSKGDAGTTTGSLTRYKCAGCDHCGHTGLRGRAGIHELMTVSRALRQLIQTNTRADDLERQALSEGMRTLRQDGIEKVLAGVTSIEEVRANS
ncbi:MAG: Flp pilus assembly complex ATPase component TadA [Chitinophagaceae bacterium]|nr:Flp pilus assembly complex ATPase component TadA [Rubrivivax sp.]